MIFHKQIKEQKQLFSSVYMIIVNKLINSGWIREITEG